MPANQKQRIIATYTINYDKSKTASISLAIDADDNKGSTDFTAGQDVVLRLYSDKKFIFDLIAAGKDQPSSSEGQLTKRGGITTELIANINEELMEFVGDVKGTVSKLIVASFSADWLGGNMVPTSIINPPDTNEIVVNIPTGRLAADVVGIANVKYLSKYQQYILTGADPKSIASMVWVIIPPEAIYPE
jgi:hypothetical protein